MPEPPPNRFEQRRLRNRAAILDVAIELFERDGIRATKLQDICEKADVAQRTFFNHFETREHLYQAIGQRRATQLATLLDAESDAARALPTRVREHCSRLARHLTARPMHREIIGEMLHLRVEGGGELVGSRTLGQAVRRLIETGVERGEVSRRHAPEALADVLIGSLSAALTHWIAERDYDLESSLREVAGVLIDLLEPRSDEIA